ncbi:MAG: thiamine-phosphate kinase [Streptosporangiales bacterium]|nr:thiamine-phosphate kinase [Streptosporangiales bacterium]
MIGVWTAHRTLTRVSITIGEVGEFGLIARLVADLPRTSDLVLGPGDDAAVLRAPDARVVATTDLLVDGRHFRRDWSSPRDVGHKAAAQNLADVAAMGARPTGLLLGLAAPPDLPVAWAEEMMAGLAAEAAAAGAVVAGGDVVASPVLTLAVTALGDLGGRQPLTRSGARPGDVVAVAGDLGRSAAGLALLAAATPDPHRPDHPGSPGHPDHPGSPGSPGHPDHPGSPGPGPGPGGADSPADPVGPGSVGGRGDAGGRDGPGDAGGLGEAYEGLVAAHRRPRPPYAEGPRAAELGATALIDVSDGLLQDLGHIATASGVGVDLFPEVAEPSPELAAAAEALGADPVAWLLGGGEDHALLGTFPTPPLAPWRVIGRVREGTGVSVPGVSGQGAPPTGWDHFRD